MEKLKAFLKHPLFIAIVVALIGIVGSKVYDSQPKIDSNEGSVQNNISNLTENDNESLAQSNNANSLQSDIININFNGDTAKTPATVEPDSTPAPTVTPSPTPTAESIRTVEPTPAQTPEPTQSRYRPKTYTDENGYYTIEHRELNEDETETGYVIRNGFVNSDYTDLRWHYEGRIDLEDGDKVTDKSGNARALFYKNGILYLYEGVYLDDDAIDGDGHHEYDPGKLNSLSYTLETPVFLEEIVSDNLDELFNN